MKKGQLYLLAVSEEDIEEAELGYPIFEDEDSDVVVGFINEIHDSVSFDGGVTSPAIEICLFAPMDDLEDHVRVLEEEIHDEDRVSDMLLTCMEANPEVRDIWAEAQFEVDETTMFDENDLTVPPNATLH